MEQEKAADKQSRISSQIESAETIDCELFDQDRQDAPKLEIQEDAMPWTLKAAILVAMLIMPGTCVLRYSEAALMRAHSSWMSLHGSHTEHTEDHLENGRHSDLKCSCLTNDSLWH